MCPATQAARGPIETPAQRALRLPELLPMIFEHLDRAHLFNAILVNSAWAYSSIPLLWRHPSLDALEAVAADRCPIYDSSIRHIDVRFRQKPTTDTGWTLARLEALTFVYHGIREEAQSKLAAALAPYAQYASITSLTVTAERPAYGSPPPAGAGGRRRRCGCSRCSARRGKAILSVIAAVGFSTRLVTLKLDVILLEPAIHGLWARMQDAPAFPLLRRADVVVDVAASNAICRVFSHAEELHIHVVGRGSTGLLAAATVLPRLRVLRVSSCDELQALEDGNKSLLLARSVTQLEHLSLDAARFQFPEDNLNRFFARLPRVRELLLPRMHPQPFGMSIFYAGFHCPELRRLQIQERIKPLFFREIVKGQRGCQKLDTLVVDNIDMSGPVCLYEPINVSPAYPSPRLSFLPRLFSCHSSLPFIQA
jgi:hypothetical protein